MADSIRKEIAIDLEGLDESHPGKLAPKAIFAGDQPVGQPYLVITEDGIALVADKKIVFSIGPEFGLNLQGIMSIAAMPEQVSFGGGYWRINPMVLSTVPSTTPTPVPWLQKSVPRLLQDQDAVKSILSDTESFSDIFS